MERIPSIINKLQERYRAGASPTELLVLLEDMRRELTGATLSADHTSAPVAVWLPRGYNGPLSQDIPADPVAENNVNIASESPAQSGPVTPAKDEVVLGLTEAFTPDAAVNEPILHVAAAMPAETIAEEKVSVSFLGVPRPPLVAVVEQEPTPEIPDPATETVSEMPALPEAKMAEDAGPEMPAAAMPASVVELPEEEAPLVFELDLYDQHTDEIPQQWEPMKIPDGFLSGAGFKDTVIAERPRELHEILANRVVAKPETKLQPETTGTGLMDKLAGGKITDLRKAVSINDRFRFINSLFRGDEAMFDRAIKTINNFGILPEAHYWMQRELVIKLGWNDEDELVQYFYQLVSRRFL